jgi:hypothetical protein
MGDVPESPSPQRREALLAELATLIARDGAAPFLAPPVEPNEASFPEPWKPTSSGVTALLRRLAWHAGQARGIVIMDQRRGALATERKAKSQIDLTEVRSRELAFTLLFVGEDDVTGALAHELGVAHAALSRADAPEPYRTNVPAALTVDPDRDLERGSIATVFLGLGVLAANASFQQYSRDGKYAGGYISLEYDVVKAGYVPVEDLTYLLAVQAVVRGSAAPPAGLASTQKAEVRAWMSALAEQRATLRERLGVAPGATGAAARPTVVRFDDVDVGDDEQAPRRAFRWRVTRAGMGLFFGLVVGFLAGCVVARVIHRGEAVAGGALLGALLGLIAGRRRQIARCSACATIVAVDATRCRKCGAAFHGDISSLDERLAAEERLDEARRDDASEIREGEPASGPDGEGDAPSAGAPAAREDAPADQRAAPPVTSPDSPRSA